MRALFLALMLACGDDVGIDGRAVGGPCTINADCGGQSRCLNDGDFPGGTCAVNCASHDECPDGARCISKDGGVCLLACAIPADCRGGYDCKGESNMSGGGDSLVCIND